MKFGLKGKLQKALIDQAYLSYKFGWHQAQVREEAKLSKNDFCKRIKEVVEEGKKISDGIDTNDLFPKGMNGVWDNTH